MIFCTGSSSRACTSSGRRCSWSACSAIRAERFDERTADDVAPARTSVPPAVAREEIVAQSATDLKLTQRRGRRRPARRCAERPARIQTTISSSSSGPMVVDQLDVVGVGIQDECGVVAGVVAGPLSRLAVAAVSGCGGLIVEPPDRVVVAGKGDVRVLADWAGHDGQEAAGAPAAERRGPGSLPDHPKSRGVSDDAVEGFGGGDVCDAERDVIDVPALTQLAPVDGPEDLF